MKIIKTISVGTLSLLASSVVVAQSGNMMDGGSAFGWMGGYGGMWVPLLVVILVAGVVAWAVAKKDK